MVKTMRNLRTAVTAMAVGSVSAIATDYAVTKIMNKIGVPVITSTLRSAASGTAFIFGTGLTAKALGWELANETSEGFDNDSSNEEEPVKEEESE